LPARTAQRAWSQQQIANFGVIVQAQEEVDW